MLEGGGGIFGGCRGERRVGFFAGRDQKADAAVIDAPGEASSGGKLSREGAAGKIKNSKRERIAIFVANVTNFGYFERMIKSFGDKETQRLFEGGRARTLHPDMQERALRRLVQIHRAVSIDDLRHPRRITLSGFVRTSKNITPSESTNNGASSSFGRVRTLWTGADAENVSIVDYH